MHFVRRMALLAGCGNTSLHTSFLGTCRLCQALTAKAALFSAARHLLRDTVPSTGFGIAPSLHQQQRFSLATIRPSFSARARVVAFAERAGLSCCGIVQCLKIILAQILKTPSGVECFNKPPAAHARCGTTKARKPHQKKREGSERTRAQYQVGKCRTYLGDRIGNRSSYPFVCRLLRHFDCGSLF